MSRARTPTAPAPAGLAALRAAAGRQAKELDPDEIKERLAKIAGREQAADESGHQGKKGIAEVSDATRVGGRRQRQCTGGRHE